MPLLAALGIGDGLWARFASLISVELYDNASSSSGQVVRVIYNGKVQHIPDCSDASGLCDYASFKQKLQVIIPTTEECGK